MYSIHNDLEISDFMNGLILNLQLLLNKAGSTLVPLALQACWIHTSSSASAPGCGHTTPLTPGELPGKINLCDEECTVPFRKFGLGRSQLVAPTSTLGHFLFD